MMEKGNFLGEGAHHAILDPWPLGWRARIGLIIPSVDPGVTSHEHNNIFPNGVTMLEGRVMFRGPTLEELEKVGNEAIYAAELLATAKADVISFTCTAGAFIKGAEYEKKLLQKIEEVSGAKSASMANAVAEALKFLGVKRVAVACPQLRTVVDSLEKYLGSYGINVVYSDALGMTDSLQIAARTPWENYRFALNVFQKASEVDALVISCGAMRAIEIIEYLEKAIGKPVVSSNLCNAWMCLKRAGIREPILGYGSLLAAERTSS